MSDKIYIYKNGQKQEAQGSDLEYILEAQAQVQEAQLLLEQQEQVKAESRISALAKLAALGLTEEEIAAL